MKNFIIIIISAFIFISCNKEKKQDVIKLGYHDVPGKTYAGGDIFLYKLKEDIGIPSNAIYQGKGSESIVVSGVNCYGFEEVTDSKHFDNISSATLYVHAILDDTLSNLFPTINGNDPMSFAVSNHHTKKRDYFEHSVKLNTTYENWWKDSEWQLDSVNIIGQPQGTLQPCLQDDILKIKHAVYNQNPVSLIYSSEEDVCDGYNEEYEGALPMDNFNLYRTLDCDLSVYDGMGTNIVFDKLVFDNKNRIRLKGILNSSNEVHYIFSRK